MLAQCLTEPSRQRILLQLGPMRILHLAGSPCSVRACLEARGEVFLTDQISDLINPFRIRARIALSKNCMHFLFWESRVVGHRPEALSPNAHHYCSIWFSSATWQISMLADVGAKSDCAPFKHRRILLSPCIVGFFRHIFMGVALVPLHPAHRTRQH